jgi:hypothetical protein
MVAGVNVERDEGSEEQARSAVERAMMLNCAGESDCCFRCGLVGGADCENERWAMVVGEMA